MTWFSFLSFFIIIYCNSLFWLVCIEILWLIQQLVSIKPRSKYHTFIQNVISRNGMLKLQLSFGMQLFWMKPINLFMDMHMRIKKILFGNPESSVAIFSGPVRFHFQVVLEENWCYFSISAIYWPRCFIHLMVYESFHV